MFSLAVSCFGRLGDKIKKIAVFFVVMVILMFFILVTLSRLGRLWFITSVYIQVSVITITNPCVLAYIPKIYMNNIFHKNGMLVDI